MNQKYSLELLEERIGYHFKDISLLKQAVTHSSYTNEMKINKLLNYERLEFLGDAVLELISSEFVFKEHTDVPEGEMTRMRASLVCEPSLAYCARKIELGEFLLLGKGEDSTGGRYRDSIVSDVMEAVIGALFIDGGLEVAKSFIYKVVLSDLEDRKLFFDGKTTLQELMQKVLKKSFSYEVVGESGPEHDKMFTIRVMMEGEALGEGKGRTKKSAEQQAAYETLLLLKKRGIYK